METYLKINSFNYLLLPIFIVGILCHFSETKKSQDASIMELINIEHIKKLLSEINPNSSKIEKSHRNYYYKNDNEDYTENTIKWSNHYNNATISKLKQINASSGRKMLKSSKNALFITKRDYLKKDWCKTEPLVQRVKEPGCVGKNIINNFCYGQCNSFYIPVLPGKEEKTLHGNNQSDLAFRSCSFCKPRKMIWITIILRCPQKVPFYRKKKIEKIKQCKCVAVETNKRK